MSTRPTPHRRPSLDFEEKTTATLEEQDKTLELQNKTLENQNRVLERMDKKLEAPVLNGGFDDLVKKVEKVENVTQQLKECHESSSKKIVDIHTAIYDPEKGIYVTVKGHDKWISATAKAGRWLAMLLITGALGGLGKVIYDLITGHIHYTP